MSTTQAQLLAGYIIYISSSVVNDFESMPVGPCVTLVGEVATGDASFGFAFFLQR